MAMAVADFLASRPGLGLTLDDFPILATDISAGRARGRPGGAVFHLGSRPGDLPRAAGAVLPARPRRLGRRRGAPPRDRIPPAQPRPAAPQPGDVRPDPVPELPDLPRRGRPPPPLSGPSSGPQPRWDPHDRRGREHLRGDGRLLDGATRQHVYPSEKVIVLCPSAEPGNAKVEVRDHWTWGPTIIGSESRVKPCGPGVQESEWTKTSELRSPSPRESAIRQG